MTFVDSLYHYLLLSAPYLIMGLVLSGIVQSFINVDTIKKWLGRGDFRDVVVASAVGVPLPLCSCSVIPTAVTLRKSGASRAATSAFLISTPESGVDSILMTYALMDWPMTIIRPTAAFFSAFLAGILQLTINKETSAPSFSPVETPRPMSDHQHSTAEKKSEDCCHGKATPVKLSIRAKLVSGLKYAFGDLINDLAFWLTLGIVVGALLDFLIPPDFFATLSGWQAKGLLILVGIPLYICASATTPIAASLVAKGLSPGAALILLLVGPATNVSNILVLQKYIGKKATMINIFSIVIVALGFSFVVDFLYANFFVINWTTTHNHQHSTGAWWEIVSVIIIVGLLAKGLWVEEIRPRLKAKLNKTEGCCH